MHQKFQKYPQLIVFLFELQNNSQVFDSKDNYKEYNREYHGLKYFLNEKSLLIYLLIMTPKKGGYLNLLDPVSDSLRLCLSPKYTNTAGLLKLDD